MKQHTVFFAHANGFPGRCYQSIFTHTPALSTYYLEKSGHHPDYPVTDNWTRLVHEYLDNLSQQCGQQKVIGIGHSLGGVLTFYAAVLRPQAFESIILLDPPMIIGYKKWLFLLLKKFNRTHWVTPGGNRVEQRRQAWPSMSALQHYVSHSGLFKRLDKQVVADFIRHGVVESEQGYSLSFDPTIEAQIFSTLPHNITRDLPKLTIPGYFLYGSKQSVVTKMDRWWIECRSPLRCMPVAGSHLFPLEAPKTTALAIEQCIQELDK